MAMNIGIKNMVFDVVESALIARAKRAENRKFEDPERRAILNSVNLSSDQVAEIDSYYRTNYGQSIPYTWHRHNYAITGFFDVRFFPELLFIPEFERYMNQPATYAEVYEDKNLLSLFADKAGIATTHALLTCTSGIFKAEDRGEVAAAEAASYLSNIGFVFAKPTVGTCSGQGCGVYDFQGGIDILSGINARELMENLGRNFSIQKVIKCHPSIAKLHPRSVNTLRVMTYRWRDKLLTLPLLMRIGCGSSAVDNAHAGGIFVGVSDEGLLKAFAITEFNERYLVHPDTGVVFNGYQISGVPRVLEAAIRMHEQMSQMGIIGWDFTVDENDQPVVIEANIRGGSIWLPQMANGVPAFGDNTAEILQWLKFMSGKRPHEREKFKFGYFE